MPDKASFDAVCLAIVCLDTALEPVGFAFARFDGACFDRACFDAATPVTADDTHARTTTPLTNE
jgi:hypothetical protein